jgi:hypothetical protein
MVASINFTAVQSKKFLRITDLFPATPAPTPKTSGLLEIGGIFSVDVETFDEETGLVKVEVSRDNTTFATHDKQMRVVHGRTYPIDDSKLPAQKKKQPPKKKQEQPAAA